MAVIERLATSDFAKKLRVAAYARVSSGKDESLDSLFNQVTHYADYIKSVPNWVYAGIFKDEAYTGTKVERKGFKELIKKCHEGKIDMIITKSVTRFARNLIAMLEIIRELRSIGVDVYFEEQNIHSINPDGEYMLTLYGMVAELEAKNTSNNMKWRIQHEFENGNTWGLAPCLGYRIKNKNYVIYEPEAKIVRLIFEMYVNGMGDQKIANCLNNTSLKPFNKKKWVRSTISYILTNINYTGNIILQKTYREDPLTKHRKVNRGEKTKYYCENTHEAIVSKELFDLAKEIREQRRIKKGTPKVRYKKHPMAGIVKCPQCGANYRHKYKNDKEIWLCSTFLTEGKSKCSSKQVPHDILMDCLRKCLKKKISVEKVKDHVSKIEIFNDGKIRIHLIKGGIKDMRWRYQSRSLSWTDEMKEKARERALKQYGVIKYAN